MLHIFSLSLTYYIWHSIWQMFWHFIVHSIDVLSSSIFFWCSIWHFIWHSIWRFILHSIWHFFLGFYLASCLAIYPRQILSFYIFYLTLFSGNLCDISAGIVQVQQGTKSLRASHSVRFRQSHRVWELAMVWGSSRTRRRTGKWGGRGARCHTIRQVGSNPSWSCLIFDDPAYHHDISDPRFFAVGLCNL